MHYAAADRNKMYFHVISSLCNKSIQDQFIRQNFLPALPKGLHNSIFCLFFVSASRLIFLYPLKSPPFPSPPLNYLVSIPHFNQAIYRFILNTTKNEKDN